MLDTAGYLSSFGWQGKGNGLRQGSVSRPLSIPQKRTLSGLGKDRDEAFPFWDHLFAAAAKSIKIKVAGDEDKAADDDRALPQTSLVRTSTGILSNRRPVSGALTSSGTVTPTEQAISRLGLMATVKRESARKRLYAGFLQGPVLGPEIEPCHATQLTSTSDAFTAARGPITAHDKKEANIQKRKHEDPELGAKGKSKRSKKSKQKETSSTTTVLKEGKMKRNESDGDEKFEGSEVAQIPLPKHRTAALEVRRLRKAAKLERRTREEKAKLETACGS